MEGETDADLEWQTACDHYPILWSMRRQPRDEDALRHEAEALFLDVAQHIDEPLLLTFNLESLLLAHAPGAGLVRFPEGTTPDVEHRDLWLPYWLGPMTNT
jgi:hypothetical protein